MLVLPDSAAAYHFSATPVLSSSSRNLQDPASDSVSRACAGPAHRIQPPSSSLRSGFENRTMSRGGQNEEDLVGKAAGSAFGFIGGTGLVQEARPFELAQTLPLWCQQFQYLL